MAEEFKFPASVSIRPSHLDENGRWTEEHKRAQQAKWDAGVNAGMVTPVSYSLPMAQTNPYGYSQMMEAFAADAERERRKLKHFTEWDAEVKRHKYQALANIANGLKKQNHDCLFEDPAEICRYKFSDFYDARDFRDFLKTQGIPNLRLDDTGYVDWTPYRLPGEPEQRFSWQDYPRWVALQGAKRQVPLFARWDAETKGQSQLQALATIANQLRKQDKDCLFTEPAESASIRTDECSYSFDDHEDAQTYFNYLQQRGVKTSPVYGSTVYLHRPQD